MHKLQYYCFVDVGILHYLNHAHPVDRLTSRFKIMVCPGIKHYKHYQSQDGRIDHGVKLVYLSRQAYCDGSLHLGT
jgi:hypothetical protein